VSMFAVCWCSVFERVLADFVRAVGILAAGASVKMSNCIFVPSVIIIIWIVYYPYNVGFK
jgi:hypothetical protein